jgi:4-hydroxybenzoate polyprenyltransferase
MSGFRPSAIDTPGSLQARPSAAGPGTREFSSRGDNGGTRRGSGVEQEAERYWIMKNVMPLLELIRPTQWIKNGFVFMPLVFSGRLMAWLDVGHVVEMFAAFCLASSATYILNDYADIEHDRAHPLKRRRPLARGDVAPRAALLLMALAVVAGFALLAAAAAPTACYVILGAYLALQIAYTFKLKHLVILDVLAISSGFLLRVIAGAAVIQVNVSSWLILCTFSVAILLALGKRRHEVVILNSGAVNHRPVLENYSVSLLDQLLQVATTSTFIFYCLYSVRGNPVIGVESEKMMFTIPIVAYGIFRYMYLIYHKEDGGSPTALLLTDPPLLACNVIWLVACVAIIYF